jgi:hypothetical protein
MLKCPLLGIGYLARSVPLDFGITDCTQGNCHWWDHEHNSCYIVSVHDKLASINAELAEIRRLRQEEERL